MSYNLDEVFNEAATPGVTFVQPREFDDLVGSLRTTGKHVTLCGPSGCGKTTLVRKALASAGRGPGDVHWMSGRDHVTAQNSQSVFGTEFACDESQIVEWLQSCGILILDDFHHLKKVVRNEIGASLKRWHERGIRVLIIGIAESTHQLLDIDSELGIRNDPYDMRTQDEAFIQSVVALGERAMNIEFSNETKTQYVAAAHGIPSAIQAICRVACTRSKILQTVAEKQTVNVDMPQIRDGVLRIYKAKYHNKVIGLVKGKQQAKSVHNTYFQIVRNICVLDESEIHVEELHKRIVQSEDDAQERAKKNTSLHNCLNNLQSVIEERGLGDALYYDPTSRTISIEDPSFRLYLSLVDIEEIAKSVRVRKTRYAWDVAVSFAGEQRAIAERLREILNLSGYTVFYDFDQKDQLWGKDLRIKLADVYANQAEYMVVLLSKEYPEKDWPKFEFEIGREAKKKRASDYLLPVVVDEVSVVGLSKDIGYLALKDHTVDEIAEILMQKIESGNSDSPVIA